MYICMAFPYVCIYIYTVTYLIMFIRMHVLFYNARLDIEIVSCYAMGWVLRYCNVCMCMHLCVMLQCILLYYICMAFGICIWHMAP